MTSHNKFIFAIALLIAVGCSKDNTSQGDGLLFEQSNSEIIFESESSDVWATKGNITTTSSLTQMELYAYYTAQNKWAELGDDDDVSQYMIAQSVTFNNSSNEWEYSPTKYWPAISGDKISFHAFAPYGEISATHDTDGKPIFAYSLSPLAAENEDLVADVAYDLTKEDGSVEFDLQHLLTKIELQAQLSGSNDDAIYGEKFTINGITFSGIYSDATLDIATEADGSITYSWSVDTSKSIDLVAAQANTLLSVDDYELTTAEPKNVMSSDKAIFALPQELTSRTDKPTVQVRIRRTYYNGAPSASNVDPDGKIIETVTFGESGEFTHTAGDDASQYITDGELVELFYETEEVAIPPVDEYDSWEMAQEILYSLTFNLTALSEYSTPLAVTSEVLEWTEVTVDADIHHNLYIYSSVSEITATTDDGVNYYGQFQICTNYEYNLRVPHHREELDGAITSSRGFLFCSDDFNGTGYSDDYNVGTIDGYPDYKIYVPTLLTQENGDEIVYVTKDNLLDYKNITVSDDDESATVDGEVIYFGSNGYGYYYHESEKLYYLLYYDYDSSKAITEFKYTEDHEIDLSYFYGTNSNTVYFKIKITDNYDFDFSVTKSTRELENLYVSTAIGTSTTTNADGSVTTTEDDSYGVNKEEDDPVYTLRLSVNTGHLNDATDNMFDDVIGVEMISNGGGMMTQLFPVKLTM